VTSRFCRNAMRSSERVTPRTDRNDFPKILHGGRRDGDDHKITSRSSLIEGRVCERQLHYLASAHRLLEPLEGVLISPCPSFNSRIIIKGLCSEASPHLSLFTEFEEYKRDCVADTIYTQGGLNSKGKTATQRSENEKSTMINAKLSDNPPSAIRDFKGSSSWIRTLPSISTSTEAFISGRAISIRKRAKM